MTTQDPAVVYIEDTEVAEVLDDLDDLLCPKETQNPSIDDITTKNPTIPHPLPDTSEILFDEPYSKFEPDISSTDSLSLSTEQNSASVDDRSSESDLVIDSTNVVKPSSDTPNNYVILREDNIGSQCCQDKVSILVICSMTLILFVGIIFIIFIKSNNRMMRSMAKNNLPTKATELKGNNKACCLVLDAHELNELSSSSLTTTEQPFNLNSIIKDSVITIRN